MKKAARITITCLLILFALVSTYGIIAGKSGSDFQSTPDDYAILTYYPESGVPYIIGRQGFSARIFYGDSRVENISLTKEEVKSQPISSAVAGILARLSGEGYKLISTSVVSTVKGNQTDHEIHCFLKKGN
jgi:hypothetical protein